jgi:hypothetical protein
LWKIDTTKNTGDGNTYHIYLENLMLLNSYRRCSTSELINSNTGEISFSECYFKNGTTGLNDWK